MNTALLVIHDIGDPRAGSAWQELVAAWPGAALAPDLPGHAETPPPTGGSYALADAAVYAWRAAEEAGVTNGDVVVLGHASGGFAAELLAAGGRASKLILVDGLGPGWGAFDEIVADQHRFLRALFADPKALAAPAGVPDPRLAHPFSSIWEPGFIHDLRSSISVPVLAVETPSSPTPAGERAARLKDYAGPAEVVDVSAASAAVVAEALRAAAWLDQT
jgi:pimeloyl-ACP methyl ester carboxylesterase